MMMKYQYNMHALIYDLPEQISDASQLPLNIRPIAISKINSIVIAGMGGSGIGGEIIKALLSQTIKIPIITIKDYELPSFAGNKTLYFAVSYSGNTEETLENFNIARRRECHIIAITTGGKLLEKCQKYHLDYVELPKGPSSRCAIGYLTLPQILCLSKLGFIKSFDKDIKETIKVMYSHRVKYDNFAKKLARQLMIKLPLVYASSSLLAPVARRWQTQLNENAEIIAHSNVFPELSHNEIVGITDPYPLVPLYYLLLLDPNSHKRNSLRLDFTLEIIENRIKEKIRRKYLNFQKFSPDGKSNLARIFSLIMLGDLISYRLAHARKVVPESISAIDELKNKLNSC
jgi:glucose/mannose-6-phosphate isomerase